MMIKMMTTTTTTTTTITTIPCPAGGDDTLAGWFSICCSRAAPEVRLTKSPAVLLTVCGNACTRTRGRAHANFSWAPFVGGNGGRVIHLTRYTRFLRRFLRFRTYSLPPVGAAPPAPTFTFIYLLSSVVVPRSRFRNWTTTMKTIK